MRVFQIRVVRVVVRDARQPRVIQRQRQVLSREQSAVHDRRAAPDARRAARRVFEVVAHRVVVRHVQLARGVVRDPVAQPVLPRRGDDDRRGRAHAHPIRAVQRVRRGDADQITPRRQPPREARPDRRDEVAVGVQELRRRRHRRAAVVDRQGHVARRAERNAVIARSAARSAASGCPTHRPRPA